MKRCGHPIAGDRRRRQCYRVSPLSGALEVTARLNCDDDLVLPKREVNRPIFAKADRLANEILTLSEDRQSLPKPLLSPTGAA